MLTKIKSRNSKYEDRDRFPAGNYYGIGEGAKIGKMRSSYLKDMPKSKKSISNPPKSIR